MTSLVKYTILLWLTPVGTNGLLALEHHLMQSKIMVETMDE